MSSEENMFKREIVSFEEINMFKSEIDENDYTFSCIFNFYSTLVLNLN